MNLLSKNAKKSHLLPIPGPWTVVFVIMMSLFSLFVKCMWTLLF